MCKPLNYWGVSDSGTPLGLLSLNAISGWIRLALTAALMLTDGALSAADTIINHRLIAHWKLDGPVGSMVRDETGQYPGTLSPTGAAFVKGGIAGAALEITSGGNGYVSFGDTLPLIDSSYTISL